MVEPASALTSLRKIVRPAPCVGLKSKLSTCLRTGAGAFISVLACPNPSDTPNPAMVWYRLERSTVTVARTVVPGALVAAGAEPPRLGGTSFWHAFSADRNWGDGD
jgi:hypothetical protein